MTNTTSSGSARANSIVACPFSFLLANFDAGFIDHLVENIVEQLADATRTATRGRPSNNKHGYDRSGKENECIFGSCLAIVVVLAPEDELNETLNVEVAVKDHGASSM